jgi:hypothetical protein
MISKQLPDNPMTDPEILEWINWLQRSGKLMDKPKSARALIVDLIRHANTDHMSVDDRQICSRALKLLLRTDPN